MTPPPLQTAKGVPPLESPFRASTYELASQRRSPRVKLCVIVHSDSVCKNDIFFANSDFIFELAQIDTSNPQTLLRAVRGTPIDEGGGSSFLFKNYATYLNMLNIIFTLLFFTIEYLYDIL